MRVDRPDPREAHGVTGPLALALILATALPSLAAIPQDGPAELAGEVVEVSGTTVTIRLSGDRFPAVGDPVALLQEIPGFGPAPVEGEWEVIDVTESSVVAAADDEAAKPQTGQQAKITSAATRSRGQLQADLDLLEAADEGSAAGVHGALGSGAEVDVRGQGGSTPLMRAAGLGHTDAMRMLLERDADVSLEARAGQTALGVAAAQGHSGAVSLLLESGAAVDAPITSPRASESMRGATPLILAARFGHAEVVRRLLRAGADPTTRTLAGETALYSASLRGNEECLAVLLEAGSDPNRARPDGATPLVAAAGEGNALVLRILVRHGARVDEPLPESVPEPYGGMTALLVAAFTGQADAVVALLEAGADPQVRNLAGADALALAAEAGHDDVLAVLRDADTAIAAGVAERNGELLDASGSGEVERARRMLLAGADANAFDQELGASPLMLAASQNRTAVLELLLEHGADPNLLSPGGEDDDGRGFSALMLAALRGHPEAVTVLLRAGADAGLRTPDGRTAASLARDRGHEEVARLIESGGR